MADFPRTKIENLSVSRMIIGTNWFLGYSHCTKARDRLITARMDRKAMADVLEVFFRAGVDTVYGARPESHQLEDAIRDAEDRTGRKAVKMGTPHFDLSGKPEAKSANERTIEGFAKIGCSVCLPHQCTTDALVDRVGRRIRDMDVYAAAIRRFGMIPGLSTHMPEVPVYADESGLDVGTYIQIYNADGFLMQIEVDWVHRMIWKAAKPVITIKPMAAGRMHPLVGMAFNWATIRPQDMVCVGTFTPDEARELIEISLSILEHRDANLELQRTRSKASVERK
ncbi:MAG TPA: hypothetical protein DCX07_02485 [Phycisphaerales bacterium]|nr:hypothetical protein [Phycisphaerales bacterium]